MAIGYSTIVGVTGLVTFAYGEVDVYKRQVLISLFMIVVLTAVNRAVSGTIDTQMESELCIRDSTMCLFRSMNAPLRPSPNRSFPSWW